MQWYTSRDGDRRLWIAEDEIERICDARLRKAGLMPTLEEPVTNLESLIEGHLGADLDQYAALPDGVLGASWFDADGRVRVDIAATLTADADEYGDATGPRGRWRSTLAHEGAHVILHKRLFEQSGDRIQGALARSVPMASIPCLLREIVVDTTAPNVQPTGSDWREVQANKGMAALLMPRTLFKRIALSYMSERRGMSGAFAVIARDDLVDRLADTFQASKQAVRIRLHTLGIDPNA